MDLRACSFFTASFEALFHRISLLIVIAWDSKVEPQRIAWEHISICCFLSFQKRIELASCFVSCTWFLTHGQECGRSATRFLSNHGYGRKIVTVGRLMQSCFVLLYHFVSRATKAHDTASLSWNWGLAVVFLCCSSFDPSIGLFLVTTGGKLHGWMVLRWTECRSDSSTLDSVAMLQQTICEQRTRGIPRIADLIKPPISVGILLHQARRVSRPEICIWISMDAFWRLDRSMFLGACSPRVGAFSVMVTMTLLARWWRFMNVNVYWHACFILDDSHIVKAQQSTSHGSNAGWHGLLGVWEKLRWVATNIKRETRRFGRARAKNKPSSCHLFEVQYNRSDIR